MNQIRIVTHLGYGDIFKSVDRHGLLLHARAPVEPEDLERQIALLLSTMSATELIQFSSFLNMICQTSGIQATMARGIDLLVEVGFVHRRDQILDRILFHREGLLNLIQQILEYGIGRGVEPLTGPGFLENKRNYSRALLLGNDLLQLQNGQHMGKRKTIFRDHVLREWPHYYVPDVARNVYRHRIVRYRYCYESLRRNLLVSERSELEAGIEAFELQAGVSLQNYLSAVRDLFGWYYELPYLRANSTIQQRGQALGFDYRNISSFYIDRTLFPEGSTFLTTIEALSNDLASFQAAAQSENRVARDPISGYHRSIRVLFRKPVFKISNRLFCIIDLKFLIDAVCGGLQWHIGTGRQLQRFRAAYGRLMERYFQFLLSNMFGEAHIRFDDASGADAVVELGDSAFVFEFTVEYYRVASLYNPTPKELVDDLRRILFNAGIDETSKRPKQDKGKMIKLDKYVRYYESRGKRVVPVLVTENMLGDDELFQEFDDLYKKGVDANGLTHLQNNAPLFLGLDDLEFFWAYFEKSASRQAFREFADEWRQGTKGPYLHSPALALAGFAQRKQGQPPEVVNQDYRVFFSNERLFD